MFGLSVPVIAGLLVLAILFAMAGFATLLRKVGRTKRLSFTEYAPKNGNQCARFSFRCWNSARALAGADVIRRRSTTEPLQQPGVAVTVEAVAQLKVKSDPVSIRTAAEQFLTKRRSSAKA